MNQCDTCGTEEKYPYECDYCGGTHCKRHRLPEKHECVGLRNATSLGPDLQAETASTGETPNSGSQANTRRRVELDRDQTVSTKPEPPSDPAPDVALDGSIAGEQVWKPEYSLVEKLRFKLRDWRLDLEIWFRRQTVIGLVFRTVIMVGIVLGAGWAIYTFL